MASRVVIRHITGVKANQTDQIELAGLVELTIGRDPACNVVFGSPRDEYVSRRHAAIRVENGDHFKLIDLDSRNGTLLNGNVVEGEVELSPADIIELGAEGPKFSFDVQPRPAPSWRERACYPKVLARPVPSCPQIRAHPSPRRRRHPQLPRHRPSQSNDLSATTPSSA